MHDMQHTWVLVRLLFPFVVIPFACYGVVVFPTCAGLHCLVVYLWYISTVVRFVTYLFSPCLPLTALCLFRWFLALRGTQHTCFSAAGGVVVVYVWFVLGRAQVPSA